MGVLVWWRETVCRVYRSSALAGVKTETRGLEALALQQTRYAKERSLHFEFFEQTWSRNIKENPTNIAVDIKFLKFTHKHKKKVKF